MVVCNLPAAEQAQRYIVILKQRTGAAPDVASLGGVIESRQDEQLVVTIPAGSLAALKADQKVRYIERVGGAPSAAEDVLIGEPADPQPGSPSPSKRLVPHALGSTPWDSGLYAYDGAGDIVTIGTDNYLYDGAQRLKQSSTKGTGETYTYDGFGNMKSKGSQTYQVDPTTNRYLGYSYNEAGAVTADGSYTFSYDPVGQPLSKIYGTNNTTQEYYLYTASDERIGVQRGGWWTWSVRDQSGKVLRQYKSSVTNPSGPALWLEDYIWRDGFLLGSQRPVEMGGRRHFHLDHLGTPRLVTSDNGQRVSYHDYYPFGDEQTTVAQEVPGGFDREEPMKFTGHERDYAGGMGGENWNAVDYMHARYYGSGVGRFLSVDPMLNMRGAIRLPQTWNRYAYVNNNALRYSDPTGLYMCQGTKEECRRFNAALFIIRAAAFEAARAGRPGATRLREVMNYYGPLGKDNGVNVLFGNYASQLNGAPMASSDNNVYVDRDLFAQNFGDRNYFRVAVEATHEADHGLYGPTAWSRSQLMRKEQSAYRTQSLLNSTLGIEDSYHIWQQPTRFHGARFDGAMIDWFAKSSVDHECQVTPCEP